MVFKTLLLCIFINECIHGRKIRVTEQVFFDVSINDQHAGGITIGLFGEVAPKTVANFLQIATDGIEGKGYVGSRFHRIIQRCMIQGGDIIYNNGSGSISIYGNYFDDENFEVKHAGPGFLSMANAGQNTNGCQFFITTMPTPWLDGKHTVFGKVMKGQDIVHRIEHLKTDVEDRPLKPVVITASGMVPLKNDLYVTDDPYELTLWMWIQAGWFPLSFSFAIMAFFHYIIKILDFYIEKIK